VKADFEKQFADFFTREFGRLFRYLDRSWGDAELAADIAQETLVRLYQRGAFPHDPRAWIVTVANNLLRDEHRRTRRRRGLLERDGAAAGPQFQAPTPDAVLITHEQQLAVREALQDLPVRDRQMLLLRHEGYSYREIARALDLGETSVGSMLLRATRAFRDAYKARQNAPQ
jgi:RNA polymerase sigma factor (sigma-70 family)